MTMSAGPSLRPVHVLAGEAGSDRAGEIAASFRAPDRRVRAHALPPGVPGEAGAHLGQEYAHVAGAVRDVLTDDGRLVLADERAALAVPEMMRVLVDEQGRSWEDSWTRTRGTITSRLGCPDEERGPFWPVPLLEVELPRLLEVLYEINQRHLEEADALWPGDGERRRDLSLFEELGTKRLRLGALAVVGSARAGVAAPWPGPAGETLGALADMRPSALRALPTPVHSRRWVRDGHPELASLLTLGLGDRWQADPEALADLEPLAFDAAFCGAFQKMRHTARQGLEPLLREKAGVATDPAALLDVRLGALRGRERVLLNVLGLIREHLRFAEGGWTPPAPRTVVIATEAGVAGERSRRQLRVARAVADAINRDPGTRARLRVGVLEECDESLATMLAAAADLSNQPGLAGSGAAGTKALGFAMNGALTLGSRDGTVRELEEAVGAENLFLFGLGPLEARAWLEGHVYRPKDVYAIDPLVRRAVDEIVSPRYAPEPGAFDWVRQWLLDEGEPWLVLADLGSYIHRQDEALAEFAHPRTFTQKAILTVARCRRFWAERVEL